MGYLLEYIKKLRDSSPQALEAEQTELIRQFNELYGGYFLMFATAIEKQIPDAQLLNADYEIIYDLLLGRSGEKLYFYIETPGGSGVAAHDIGRLLHQQFSEVNFVITGEAKSAGTILALSGDNIFMTDSGSLGPIDAQINIGRSRVSAHAYLDGVKKIEEKVCKEKNISKFDAVILAQISPGELTEVYNALHYGIDLVKEWLPQYKFKKWKIKESSGTIVTDEIRKARAQEIAEKLTDQSTWRRHGRSLKINDMIEIGLKINRIDDDPQMANLVYRIQAINRMLFGATSIFKIFATAEGRIHRQATESGGQAHPIPLKNPNLAIIEARCNACQEVSKFYLKFESAPGLDKEMMGKGVSPYPKNGQHTCFCGALIDLSGLKTEIEMQFRKQAIIE